MTSTTQPPTGGLAAREGLDPDFLGTPVPLPRPRDTALETVLLRYTHFEVLMRTDRRLAAVTGVGIDGAALRDLGRDGLEWWLDPRLGPDQQTGEEVYANNDLDRGHLVRRRAPVWGEDAGLANADTFSYPNAAPQAAAFNQEEELWLGLENYLLDDAATYDRRLVVFTGPVLAPDDPVYRGVGIPRLFFKVAAFLDDGELAATAYLLDQSPALDDVPGVGVDRPLDTDDAPPLGRFRTYQVPVADVAELSGLDLDQLVAVDRPPRTAAATTTGTGSVPTGWLLLERLDQVDLGRRPRRAQS